MVTAAVINRCQVQIISKSLVLCNILYLPLNSYFIEYAAAAKITLLVALFNRRKAESSSSRHGRESRSSATERDAGRSSSSSRRTRESDSRRDHRRDESSREKAPEFAVPRYKVTVSLINWFSELFIKESKGELYNLIFLTAFSEAS